MNSGMEKSLSKLMTKMLRHEPERFGLVLDPEDGSCETDELVLAIQDLPGWKGIAVEDVEQVVRNSDKQRFAIEGGRIRARYGHSHDKVRYELGNPPAVLYHGTSRQALAPIMEQGLRPMGRQYVHLSEGTGFASLAGKRKGELVLLRVDTVLARELGVTFYFAGNEVWLSGEVPAECVSVGQTEAIERGEGK